MGFRSAEQVADDLLSKATRLDNGCLICHLKPSGCGYVYVTTRSWAAHRLIYSVKKGHLPLGMIAMHTCDTKNCIEPDHLIKGSQMDNARDREAKGRGRWK